MSRIKFGGCCKVIYTNKNKNIGRKVNILLAKSKIAVLVSGGVDSSVALALLKEQGHEVEAFYLKIWLEDELSYLGSCPWEDDIAFAQGVCQKLQVPLHIVSLQRQYHAIVVQYLLDEIKQGRTPNPDVLCNQHIKFGAFFKTIDASFKYIATGHYARVMHTKQESFLLKGLDPIKDQSYFLALLAQAQLTKALFPIGGYQKSEIRALAKQFDLPTYNRKDSQGICFLGKFEFSQFLKAHVGCKPGSIVAFETKEILGQHNGFWFFTIGQRYGLGLSGGPWYVVCKDVQTNVVYVSRQYADTAMHKSGMLVSNFHWISGKASDKTALSVRFRHGPAVHDATVTTNDAGAMVITLHEKSSQGIAAGQFAVLYDGDVCLGGGVIDQAF